MGKIENMGDLHSELKELSRSIRKILEWSGWEYYEELDGLKPDHTNPEERLLYEESTEAVRLLEKASSLIEYTDLPIRREGILRLQNNGRYDLGGMEITSGAAIEVLVPFETLGDDGAFVDAYRWAEGNMEYRNADGRNGYYHTGAPELESLDGYRARMR